VAYQLSLTHTIQHRAASSLTEKSGRHLEQINAETSRI